MVRSEIWIHQRVMWGEAAILPNQQGFGSSFTDSGSFSELEFELSFESDSISGSDSGSGSLKRVLQAVLEQALD